MLLKLGPYGHSLSIQNKIVTILHQHITVHQQLRKHQGVYSNFHYTAVLSSNKPLSQTTAPSEPVHDVATTYKCHVHFDHHGRVISSALTCDNRTIPIDKEISKQLEQLAAQ